MQALQTYLFFLLLGVMYRNHILFVQSQLAMLKAPWFFPLYFPQMWGEVSVWSPTVLELPCKPLAIPTLWAQLHECGHANSKSSSFPHGLSSLWCVRGGTRGKGRQWAHELQDMPTRTSNRAWWRLALNKGKSWLSRKLIVLVFFDHCLFHLLDF